METWAEPGEPRQVRIDGKAATQASLGRVLRGPVAGAGDGPAVDRGRRGPPPVSGPHDAVILCPTMPRQSLAYEKAMRDRNRLLKDQVTDAHWYAALGGADGRGRRSRSPRNRRAAIARMRQAADGRRQRLSRGRPDADRARGSDEPCTTLPPHWPKGAAATWPPGARWSARTAPILRRAMPAKDMPADQCSTGEQKALLISLILANARALAAGSGRARRSCCWTRWPPIWTDRRAALYDEICALGRRP